MKDIEVEMSFEKVVVEMDHAQACARVAGYRVRSAQRLGDREAVARHWGQLARIRAKQQKLFSIWENASINTGAACDMNSKARRPRVNA